MGRVVILALCLGACGLTARGSAGPDGGAGDEDASVGVGADGGSDVDIVDANVFDAVEAAPCEVAVEDAFTTQQLDPAKWLTTNNAANTGYPRPYFTEAGSQVSMIEPTTDGATGGLWFIEAVPFAAFEVAFDAQMVCNSGPCGDGMAAVFLEKATKTQLAAQDSGGALGMPRALSGVGVSLDLAQNGSPMNDGPTPNVAVLDIDGSKAPASYGWNVATSAQNNQLKNNGIRRIALSLRNGQITVRIDGVVAATGTVTRAPKEGTFGFVAASGAYNAGLYVGAVQAKFYRCNAP